MRHILPLLLLGLLRALPGGEARVLLAFDAGFDLARATGNSTEVARGGTAERPALRATMRAGGSWPGVSLAAPAGGWDLSAYEFLAVDLRNVDDHDLDLFVRVDNPGANGREHCLTERIGVQPDQRVTLTIPLKRRSASPIRLVGMHGCPQGLHAEGGIDPAQITGLVVFGPDKPARSGSFEVSEVRVFGSWREPPWLAMDEKAFFPCIDRYGQFRHRDWPGKVRDDADLQARRTAEEAELAAQPGPADWDAWGGWREGPQLEASGHFRTARHGGRWWLVDPDGRLFFSFGLTCVNLSWAATPVDDREHYFAELPTAPEHPFAAFLKPGGKSWGGGYYQGRSPRLLDHSGANLLRKYGADWRTTYPEVVHRRLRSWGVNTLGNWSDLRIARLQRTPYTATFWYDSPRLGGGKIGFPDMFDPAFAPALAKGFAQHAASTADDPWCLGYFLDNEMPWGGEETLAGYALASPATQAAKRAFAERLQQRYDGIAALNTAWGTSHASWEAFLAETKSRPATAAGRADLVAFTGEAAEAYFRSVREAIRGGAPKKLYLGCRCVGGGRNLVAAAVRHCDVLSYNRYCASVADIGLPDGLDAPILIGEFHFGGLDRGQFWGGLFSAEDQADRARKLTAYLRSAWANPLIVGAHWFQYGDEATTGRIDGENAQCGFVDVCDTPYAETVAEARAAGAAMYRALAAPR